MSPLDIVDAKELLCWISNLEMALENLQRAVADQFVCEDSTSRRALLDQIISQCQLWLERPVDEIQKLIAIKDGRS